MKEQLTVYLEPDLMHTLAEYAERRGKPKSLVAEAAIASFLSPDAAERQEASLARRLDRITRQMERLEWDVGISVETVALFIRFWLMATPSLPQQTQAAARAKSRGRVSGAGLCSPFFNFHFGGPETGSTVDGDWFAERPSGASPAPRKIFYTLCNGFHELAARRTTRHPRSVAASAVALSFHRTYFRGRGLSGQSAYRGSQKQESRERRMRNASCHPGKARGSPVIRGAKF